MGYPIRTGHGTRLALLLVGGLALAACQPAEQGGTEGATEGQDAASGPSAEQLIQMERSLWEALAQGDLTAFGEKIASDAVLVGGQGLTTKQEMMSMLEGGALESYEVSDFQVMQPGSGVGVITYHYTETYTPADADSAVNYAGWATSIWEDRDGTWMTVFHQSTEEAPEAESME